ncbi:hypothetical protein [uncultured Methanobrevibacter sp.]|uniref:hypothetical protein n=1 Tax=uncultured Methanobrevibacter sp. TaxID=253161 RepID=UPI00342029F8
MILGNAPFIAEPYFGHRARLYDLDLHRNPNAIADVIVEAYNNGVKSINLVNDAVLIEGFEIALDDGCEMKVVATIGKSDVDYMNPNYDVAKEVDWDDDIGLFSNYDCPLMLVDEFIVDGYDWNLTADILSQINNVQSASGLITAFPNKTTDLLIDNPILDLFDYYMLPINKLAYMMDIPSFLPKEREEFKNKVNKLNKKIIATRVLAAGILKPDEAFDFLNTLNYVDLVTVGVASKEEAKEDFTILKNI